MKTDYSFHSQDELTISLHSIGISTWNQLTTYISKLPYGRNENREDVSLVLSEKKGTCSSKHALLKELADFNNVPDVKLILGIYKMNRANTPGIGAALEDHSITYIPEAHCYLKVKGNRFDFTSKSSNLKLIEKDILKELEISPDQAALFKISYHKSFIKEWLEETKFDFAFDDIWRVREECIHALTR
ncbi:MAG: hypothetical protein ACJAZC_001369 [Cryomorphaceae bacterium]|jgi:hypothetical protein